MDVERRISVTIGIPAYNEERNIGRLLDALLHQETRVALIEEVVVVASGCTDATPSIVEERAAADPRIVLISEERRSGKASAINHILKAARGEVVVLESADTMPARDTVELLVRPFLEPSVGVVASHPVPVDHGPDLMSSMVMSQWVLHHLVSLQVPKTGEMFAFRRVIDRIPDGVGADEDWIRCQVEREGLQVLYEPAAVVYNAGPRTLTEFIKQRMRCNVQELYQRQQMSFSTPTWRPRVVFNALLGYLRQPHPDLRGLLAFALLEAVVRSYSLLRVRLRAEDLPLWEALPSTKEVKLRK